MIATIAGIIVSYLVGAIPFGYLAGKTLRGVDVREYGSGNVGATNVLRVLGKGAGILVLLLDAGKGVVSVLALASLAQRWGQALNPAALKALCGAAAIVGHDWPIFLRFRGGKGVATGIGVFVSLAPLWALVSLVLFLIAVFITKHVSVGSLVLAASLPVLMLIAREPGWYLGLGFFWLVSALYLHRGNIRRLLRGEEARIGQKHQVSREDR